DAWPGAIRNVGRFANLMVRLPRTERNRFQTLGAKAMREPLLPKPPPSGISRPPVARPEGLPWRWRSAQFQHAQIEQPDIWADGNLLSSVPRAVQKRGPIGPPKGEPNAQAQDEVRRQEALQGDRQRQGALRALPQAPRHDQADK